MPRLRFRSELALLALLALPLAVAPGFAADQAPAAAGMPEKCPMMADAPDADGGCPMCAEMKAKHEAMQSQMKTMDDKLAALVATMNGAKGDARLDATVAVVNELVAQRTALRDMAMGAMGGHGGMGMGMTPGHGMMHGGCMEGGEGHREMHGAMHGEKGECGCPQHHGADAKDAQ